MPVKRRQPKRRASVEAEIEAWSCLFATGYDFFGDLGLSGTAEERAAGKEAWHRLGSSFMAQWVPNQDFNGEVPWALEAYGEPVPCQ